jgi:8-oxo-dGTP pyrophosphatase MutT (NUDIX family)
MPVTDAYFERVYNKRILRKLKNKFGSGEPHHVDLTFNTLGMLEMAAKVKQQQRRGEVVIVVPNKQGELWLHTKAFYPAGIYRLMTGGVEAGEKPHLALQREAREETGFKIKIDRCLAVITYTLRKSDEPLAIPFVSYVFLTKPEKGQPRPLDPKENIAGFKAVSVSALKQVPHQLRSLEGKLGDWGKFRAVAHEVVGQVLA